MAFLPPSSPDPVEKQMEAWAANAALVNPAGADLVLSGRGRDLTSFFLPGLQGSRARRGGKQGTRELEVLEDHKSHGYSSWGQPSCLFLRRE